MRTTKPDAAVLIAAVGVERTRQAAGQPKRKPPSRSSDRLSVKPLGPAAAPNTARTSGHAPSWPASATGSASKLR